MKATAFLFSSGRASRLARGGPTEFCYGYAELSNGGRPVAMFEEQTGFGQPWPRFPEAVSSRIAGLIGVSPRLVLRLDNALRGPLAPFDFLVATTQSIGMALAALKAFGRHDKRLILMTMGLLVPDSPGWKRELFRRLLKGVDLAALSKPEAAWLRSWMGPETRVHDFSFGVDLDFWTPGGNPGEEVLSIGNDPARDFATLVAAWKPEFPLLRIITSGPVESSKANIIVERGDWRTSILADEDIRERFRQAKVVITPVIDTMQPSGQSATLQAMACGRPVIMSKNRGLWDPDFMSNEICRLVPPGDSAALSLSIAALLNDRAGAEALGQAARRAMVERMMSSASMADQIEQLAI